MIYLLTLAKRTMGRVGPELNSQKSSQPKVNKELNNTAHNTPIHERVHDPVHNLIAYKPCPEKSVSHF
jgi:hypothetical protein